MKYMNKGGNKWRYKRRDFKLYFRKGFMPEMENEGES